VSMKDKDRCAFEVLSGILGSPLSGRIFMKVREDMQKSYRLGGSYSPGIDTGFVYFYVGTTAEDLEKVKEILLKEINALKEHPVSDEELKDTKTYLKGTWKMGRETSAAFAYMTTLDELYGLGFQNYKKFEENIDKVSKEDILRIAQTYLLPEKAVTAIRRPSLTK